MRLAQTAPLVLAAAFLASACSSAPSGGGGGRVDQATLTRLEADARALVRTDGCSAGSQCRTAPVGDRPCGGPREYVVYCAATTDSAALFRKLGELRDAERAYNQQQGLASTCEFRTPPATALVGGRCQAGGAATDEGEVPQ